MVVVVIMVVVVVIVVGLSLLSAPRCQVVRLSSSLWTFPTRQQLLQKT